MSRLPEFVRHHLDRGTPVREYAGELRAGRRGSLSVRLDDGRWYDFETGFSGGPFALVGHLAGTRSFEDTLRTVAAFVGGGVGPAPSRVRTAPRPGPRDTTAAARRLWNETRPIRGTAAAAYLESRGVGYIADAPSLRFHAALPHPTAPGRFPVLVSGVQDVQGRFLGVQRTYLDGPEKANVAPVRASLGRLSGGAVRLIEAAGERLLVGEGLETTAAAVRVLGWRGGAWATLGTCGLRAVRIPEHVTEVTIAADRDRRGGGQRAAAILARRLEGEGRRVRTNLPSLFAGDFADELEASSDARVNPD